VVLDGHVVVDIDPHALPLGVDEAFCGQRLEGRAIQTLEAFAAALAVLAHGPSIERCEQLTNAPVELGG
jgi:hypothetical protein